MREGLLLLLLSRERNLGLSILEREFLVFLQFVLKKLSWLSPSDLEYRFINHNSKWIRLLPTIGAEPL